MFYRLSVSAAALLATACASGAAGQHEITDCRSEVAALEVRLTNASAKLEQQQSSPDDPAVSQPNVVERLVSDYRPLANQLTSALGDAEGAVFTRDGRLVVQIQNSLLFAPGKPELTAGGRAVLERLAPILAQLGGRDVLVASHTDEPAANPSGKAAASRELTGARAVAVVRFLEKRGVDPSIIGGAGYGWYRPEAGNLDPEGREINRRTEILIMPWLDDFAEIPVEL